MRDSESDIMETNKRTQFRDKLLEENELRDVPRLPRRPLCGRIGFHGNRREVETRSGWTALTHGKSEQTNPIPGSLAFGGSKQVPFATFWTRLQIAERWPNRRAGRELR